MVLSENGDINGSNLSQTDLSFGWPVASQWSAVGRGTQNWGNHHFVNLLYGLQYDTCCWLFASLLSKTLLA